MFEMKFKSSKLIKNIVGKKKNNFLLRVQHTLCVTDKLNGHLPKKTKKKKTKKKNKEKKIEIEIGKLLEIYE